MQTSGLLLDVYDDYNGEVIRSIFPTFAEVPGLVKQAQVLSGEQRDLLPDDAFALVLKNGENTLRKYACVDAGNTMLSVLYFLENGHKLPDEAQKVAAANLSKACAWYEIGAPELEKIALMGWAVRKAGKMAVNNPFTAYNLVANGPEVARETGQAVAGNQNAITAIRNAEGDLSGGRPISPEEVAEHRFRKAAEASGTALMPMARASRVATTKGGAIKAANAMRPHVDVTDKEATIEVRRKVAFHYALGEGENGRYPLDSYAEVKTASAYFDEHGKKFSPAARHDYCVNLVKRASELGISVSPEAQKYGSEEFAPAEEIKVAYETRRNLIEEGSLHDMLTALFEKRAEIGPEIFCATLEEFDKLAGINRLYEYGELPDPYYSTFGKVAEATVFSEVIGNELVTDESLRALARNGGLRLKAAFNDEFAEEFRKDPVGIFKSMPRDQKVVIMRMAAEQPGVSAVLGT